MKARIRALSAMMAVAGLLSIVPLSAHALGFGQVRVLSDLGQPLRAEVDLHLGDRESLDEMVIRHASATDYERQAIPFNALVSGARISVQSRNGRPMAIVTTAEPVDRSALQLILKSESSRGMHLRSFNFEVGTSALNGPSAAMGERQSRAVTIADATRPPAPTDSVRTRNEPSALYLSLIETGARPTAQSVGVVKSSGRRQHLRTVLPNVVPKDWKAYAADDSVRTAPALDWDGRGRVWLTVLDEVMERSRMTATLDWSRKEVTFLGLDRVEPVKAAQPAHSALPDPHAGTAVAMMPANAASPLPAQAPVHKEAPATLEAFAATPAASSVLAAAPASLALARTTTSAAVLAQLPDAPSSLDLAAQARSQRMAEALFQARLQLAGASQPFLASNITPVSQVALAAQENQAVQVSQALKISPATQLTTRHVHESRTLRKKAAEPAQILASSFAADQIKSSFQRDENGLEALARAGNPAPAKTLVFTGERPAESLAVHSSGFDVSLSTAVERILPSGWTSRFDDPALGAIDSVFWIGRGRDWSRVLSDTLAVNGVTARVDVDMKEVVIQQ